jgi:hypothetical protein
MTEPVPPHPAPEHAIAAGHPPAAAALFPEDEWRLFRLSDKIGATYIVGLMAGIFSVGLVLYLIVLWSCLA